MADGELVVYPQLKWWRPEAAAKSALEGARNCAAATGAGAANAAQAAGGELITHHAFRLAAGNPKKPDGSPSGLSTAGSLVALKSYGVDAERIQAGPVSGVYEALQAGHIVLLAVSYASINELYPEYSGQRDFMGQHSIALEGYRRRDPRIGYRNSTRSHDPLYDGRCRDWGCAPRGPQLVPMRMARLAAGEFRPDGRTPIGFGLATYIIVRRPAA